MHIHFYRFIPGSLPEVQHTNCWLPHLCIIAWCRTVYKGSGTTAGGEGHRASSWKRSGGVQRWIGSARSGARHDEQEGVWKCGREHSNRRVVDRPGSFLVCACRWWAYHAPVDRIGGLHRRPGLVYFVTFSCICKHLVYCRLPLWVYVYYICNHFAWLKSFSPVETLLFDCFIILRPCKSLWLVVHLFGWLGCNTS